MQQGSSHDFTSERGSGASLQFERITKHYADVAAVDNLDLTIRPGEFVTLLGASGSGKTTTLMMLAGFTQPSSGRILIGGSDVTLLPAAKRNLGVVFQNYSLFPHMTIEQNLAFPLQMRRVSKHEIREKVGKALEMVKLDGMSKRYPHELSGGQQQRIALARALIFEPRALLMDEPLGALDKNLREHMQLEIKRLHTTLGATVVFVTHDQEEALTMSDRVAVMQDGKIAQISSPHEIYERPKNRWVADFIGQSNYLAGQIRSVNEGQYDVLLDNGSVVTGTGATRFTPGDRVLVMLRPEQINVSTTASGPDPIRATVREILYMGHTVKAELVLADGTSLTAQFHNQNARAPLLAGSTVYVSWNTDELWLIAEDVVAA